MPKIKENKIASNVFWNTFGSLFYFGCQWLLNIAIVRISKSYEDAGVLSLAMSITNVFSTIAFFNVRNYQVSDTEEKYKASEYCTHRLMTCGIAFLLCMVFTLINGYSFYVCASIVGFMIVKIIEAYADVLHGIAQKDWRLDIAGKSYILRGILLIGSFSVFELIFKNLAVSIAAMALTNLLALLIYDLPKVSKLKSISFYFDKNKLIELSKTCLPLLIYGICTNSIVSSARYFIEMIHGEQALGYYSTVSSIAVIVQAFVTLIFTPLIGVFTEHYSRNDKKAIGKLLLKLTSLLIGITALAMIVIFFFGEFAMVLLFGEEIRPHVYLLYPTVLASCITAFMWLLGMILVVMRNSKILMCGAIAGFVTSVILSLSLIPSINYTGANISVLVSLALISIIYLARIIIWGFSKTTTEKI